MKKLGLFAFSLLFLGTTVGAVELKPGPSSGGGSAFDLTANQTPSGSWRFLSTTTFVDATVSSQSATFNGQVNIANKFVYTSSFPTIANNNAANSRPNLLFVSPTFTNYDILCNDPDGCDIGFSFGTANQVIYVRQRGDITTGKLYMADVGPGSFQQDLEGNWVGNQAVAVGNYIGDQISLQYNAFSQDWIEQYRSMHITGNALAMDNYVLRTSSTEAGYTPVPSLWISTESIALFGGSTLVKSSGTLTLSGTRAFTPAMFNYVGGVYAYNYIYPFACTEVKNGAPATVTIVFSAFTGVPNTVTVENLSAASSKDFLCWFIVKP